MNKNNLTTTITQGNALTTARYQLSSLEKNIIYKAMSLISEDDLLTNKRFYPISIKEVNEQSGVTSNYQEYREAAEKLNDRVIRFKNSEGNEVRTSWAASAEYKKGLGLIELEFSEKLKPVLFGLKQNFTSFQLELALKLKSKYSKRIYEMMSQFKVSGVMHCTLADFKSRLGLIDQETGKESYPRWTMFESRILKVAEKEINEFTDIKIKYTGLKQGRKFTKIKFEIKSQEYQKDMVFTDQTTKIYDRLVNSHGLTGKQAERIISDFAPKVITQRLYNINLNKMGGPKNRAISNMAAYTYSTFYPNYKKQ
jgi:plasmid replication initiation protein